MNDLFGDRFFKLIGQQIKLKWSFCKQKRTYLANHLAFGAHGVVTYVKRPE